MNAATVRLIAIGRFYEDDVTMPRLGASVGFLMLSVASVAVFISSMLGFFHYLSYVSDVELAASHSSLAREPDLGSLSRFFVVSAEEYKASAHRELERMTPSFVLLAIVLVSAATRLIVYATPRRLTARHARIVRRINAWSKTALLVIVPSASLGIMVGMTILVIALVGD